ncbi:interferon-induced GTP-binding protein Mx2 isoform X1 [Ictalurus furcatus]|uniref:interferon-induced GTP-binding protein Mx2 isoform X1 n=1 Tax=Ictalurus furcatus TaxID=66913 RepID=UPI002350F93B|nr:interferon-induced GTP-binding protein Mx2 isoform X1 [Ictalurus furcatus]
MFSDLFTKSCESHLVLFVHVVCIRNLLMIVSVGIEITFNTAPVEAQFKPQQSSYFTEGIVTRCPLELKMKKNRKTDFWHGKIKYEDYEEEIEDPADVEQMIRKAQNEIAGAGMGISDKLISLEVTSSNVPDLTLIDLPGITRVAVKDQPENIGEQSKRLIKKFITKQETINLVVVPCNVDIATTEALKMALEVDPNGERTFGVLTKPDLVDKGSEETVLSVINNEIIYLNKGYMIVRCRGQQEIKDHVSLNETVKKERDFFEDHPHFSTLYDKRKATIPNLAEKLTLELVLHIERCLPQLEEQILMKLAEIQAEVDRYGSGPPTEPEQRIYFMTDKITAFTQDAINLTTGEEVKSMSYINIFSGLRKQFSLWKNDLDSVGETFNKRIEKEMQAYEEKYRGRELPSFLNYKTFEVIVKGPIKQLEEPAIVRLKEISDLVKKEFIQLAQSNFPGFPNLYKIAKTKIENIKQVKESETESMLRTQFKMEMMIYTQDSMYKNNLHMLKIMEEEEERQKFGVACPPSQRLYDHSDSEGTLEELTRHLKSYYCIVTKRLADQVPMVIRYMMLQESAAQLQREMIQLIQDRHNIDELLKEDHDIASKRNNLHSRQKRLTEALKYLAKF